MGRSKPRQLSDEEIAEVEEARKNAPVEDVTTFEEDDDPLSLAGDFVDENEDGVDDREQTS
jgi:hypothetical protein